MIEKIQRCTLGIEVDLRKRGKKKHSAKSEYDDERQVRVSTMKMKLGQGSIQHKVQKV